MGSQIFIHDYEVCNPIDGLVFDYARVYVEFQS